MKKQMRRIDVLAVAVGSIIGWGCFVMPGNSFLPAAGPIGTVIGLFLAANGMEYLPFVGKVSGSPSILEGTNEEIIQNAKDLMAKGIKGFDILAYRHVVDGEKLAYDFCAAVPAKICIAGSINSFKRIDTMFDIGPWTFTMGSALFEKKFLPEGSFRENLIAVADYMAKK